MADKSVENMTEDEKITHAKDLYQRGSRCYLVRDYSDAADFLSEACSFYAELYGYDGDELGLPQLLYAKSLIALAQEGEHKILEVNDAQESDEEGEQTAADALKVNEGASTSGGSAPPKSNSSGNIEATDPSVGASGASGSSNVVYKKHAVGNDDDDNDDDDGGINEKGGYDDDDDEEEDQDDNDSNTPTENLQIAWEILELVVKIFERQPASNASNLSEAYFGLAEISLENSRFDTALRDYNRSLEILMKLPDDNLRLIAEIQYKVGLCHMSISAFDESIVAFEKARDVLDAEVENQQTKLTECQTSAMTEKINATIEDLKELKLEIVAKITDVQESIQDIKRELAAQLMGGSRPTTTTSSNSKQNGNLGNDGATSSSKSTETPKPTDISHLIKRKKPDSNVTGGGSSSTPNSEGSPAKKVAH